jgi:heme-degrading monooxygenase HmoA
MELFRNDPSRTAVIIREWRGRAAGSNPDAYPNHFRSTVMPELRGLSGFLGAHLCRRPLGNGIEFLVLTKWQSMDAIRSFAGADAGKAIVEPGGVAALVDFDDRAQHYETIEGI